METRSIKELLILLRESIRNDIDKNYPSEMNGSGLCVHINHLYTKGKITSKEKFLLRDYLMTHKPKRVKYIGYNQYNPEYWWPKYLKKPRLQWLTKHINKL